MDFCSRLGKLVAHWPIFIALLIIPAGPLRAEEEKPTGDFTVAVLSQYVSRGYELTRNSIVVQPSITIGYKGLIANLWGNLDTRPYFGGVGADPSYPSQWNETDWTLSYTRTLGKVNAGLGYIYYGFGPLNKDAPYRVDAQELFVSLSLNTLLSPTMTIYKEVSHYRNWFAIFGLCHVFELNSMVSLKLTASASYLLSTYADAALFNAGSGYGGFPKFDGNALATNEEYRNFHDGVITVSVPVKATGHITITPTVSYTFPLTEDARNDMKGQGLKGSLPADRDSTFLVGGVTTSVTF